jgi:SAM-dependent methyltransferase
MNRGIDTDSRVPPELTVCTWQQIWTGFEARLLDLARRHEARAVAELGGGANPVVGSPDWEFVSERVVLDISDTELAKGPSGLEKRQVDLCGPVSERDRYDLVFSQMLCEHLTDASSFHRNCFQMLRPGGRAVHFFPTLYALPYVVNRVVPDGLSTRLLDLVQPGLRSNEGKLGKFPAYYNWCKGPLPGAMAHFQSVGFEIEAWQAAFGHSYYKRLPWLDRIEQAKARLLIRHPVNQLTTFACITLRKPLGVASG